MPPHYYIEIRERGYKFCDFFCRKVDKKYKKSTQNKKNMVKFIIVMLQMDLKLEKCTIFK